MEKELTKVLSSIERIEAKIDLLTLEASKKDQRTYDIDFMKEVFQGGFYIDPEHHPSDDRNYAEKFIKQLPNFQINFFTDPLSRSLPPLRIEICPRDGITNTAYKQFLIWLNQSIPNLWVWSVEYTIDQYSRTSNDVSALYEMEKQYLHFRHIEPSKPSVYSSIAIFVDGKTTRTNRTVYFDGGRTMKIYERGNDKNDNRYGDG